MSHPEFDDEHLLPDAVYDADLLDDDFDDPPRKWTAWRIIGMILIILAVIALVGMQFYGWIVEPIRVPELPPPPTISA